MQPSAASEKRLPIHEWMAVVSIILTFVLLTFLSFTFTEKTLPEVEDVPDNQPLIEVAIEGKVRNPGVYQVEKGTPLMEVIHQAEPLPGANLKRFKKEATIVKKRKIVIK